MHGQQNIKKVEPHLY